MEFITVIREFALFILGIFIVKNIRNINTGLASNIEVWRDYLTYFINRDILNIGTAGS